METIDLSTITKKFLDAWNAQDVDAVLACYTDDLFYRDPNTRGAVQGTDAMRRYLTKLFAAWTMTWAEREAFPLEGVPGAAFLWRATFRKPDGEKVVSADGMDLVVLKGDRIARNEVYFDRAIFAELLG